jgi:antitoxin MazE
MGQAVRTSIIQIGNSQGVRIPKPLLEQSGLTGEVELEVQEDQIVIRSARRAREDWGERFKAMAEQGDDRFLTEETLPTTWDEKEWEW